MAFQPPDDPLGIAVQGRAREKRLAQQLSGLGPSIPVGPLPDPKWAGYFEAIDEATPRGKRLAFSQDTSSVPLDPADSVDAMNAASPYEMKPMAPSNQLGMAPPAHTLDALSLRSLKRGRR